MKASCATGKCGRCMACHERWERIFREKFEDPDYYLRRAPRIGSTLGKLADRTA